MSKKKQFDANALLAFDSRSVLVQNLDDAAAYGPAADQSDLYRAHATSESALRSKASKLCTSVPSIRLF